MHEKRKEQRATAGAHIAVHDINTGHQLGQVVNLSGEGMMLICPQPIEQDLIFQLHLVLESPDGNHKSLRCGVESLWSIRTHQDGRYWAGFHIIDISLDALEMIEILLEAWLNEKDGEK